MTSGQKNQEDHVAALKGAVDELRLLKDMMLELKTNLQKRLVDLDRRMRAALQGLLREVDNNIRVIKAGEDTLDAWENLKDMGDKYKFFMFMEGLMPYSYMELERQKVDSLPKAIQVECLEDYQVEASKDKPQLPVRGGYKRGQHQVNLRLHPQAMIVLHLTPMTAGGSFP
ncbi:hypothetical protein HAX54_018728 [Datura stramonium]|uniref:Uncharacterized protein n=1 Tax=Datura stramonium TaxID=4076 RepID=A0ABS8UQ17_DATST|nr:hypothetical protein [Datura stramonium]